MDLYNEGFTIGQLASRTGVGVSTLRAWERRHGFPVPRRMPSGHRRYDERDVEAVRGVVRDRASGVTLEAALARAAAERHSPPTSVFATVSNTLPDVTPIAWSHAAMLSVSRAIEDEAAVRARAPVFLGSFQQAPHWRATKPSWRRIAARSRAVVAIAAGIRHRITGTLCEMPIPAGSPMAEEWAVICDSPSFAACLVGVERPASTGRSRTFEALWTVEPLAVREAARAATAIAAPPYSAAVVNYLDEPVTASYDTIRAASALMNRSLVYLDARPVTERR